MTREGFTSGGELGKAGRHQAKPSTGGEPGSDGDLQAGVGGRQRNPVESQKSTLVLFLGGTRGYFCLFLLLCHAHGVKMRWAQGSGRLLGLVGWRWGVKHLLLPTAALASVANPFIYCTRATISAKRSS